MSTQGASSDAPQVLTGFDKKTRSRVILVGCMHFNPASISLARDVVNAEAATGDLRAVAVESCPTRWNSTLTAQPPGSVLRYLCDNEMQSAAEAGETANATVELIDETIENVGRRVSQLLALTLVELFTPFAGGWKNIYDDFASALQQVRGGEAGATLLTSEAALGVNALLDPRLVVGAPLSLIRYPLSLGLKAPIVLGVVGLLIFGSYSLDMATEDTPAEFIGATLFAILETVFLGRVLLVGLLEERNHVLARNIRRACFANKPGGSIVAVLGMAHCNVVAQLLRDSRIV